MNMKEPLGQLFQEQSNKGQIALYGTIGVLAHGADDEVGGRNGMGAVLYYNCIYLDIPTKPMCRW